MTVKEINKLATNIIINYCMVLPQHSDYQKVVGWVHELAKCARGKAEEDEKYVGLSEKERIAWKLKPDKIMLFPDIEPKIEEAYTAEDSLCESQIYIAGFMDCSHSIWQHLQNCLDSIHNQRKAD